MQYLLRVQFHLFVSHSQSSSQFAACFILFFALFTSCARQGAPAGGPKDLKPPQMDTLASTPNFSTRFDRKRIELKFDEWLVLSDINTQVVVSPPLVKRPEILLKGKKIILNFDKNEQLHPNTTYTINFGTAVKDLHEGNANKDLRFVFSTGDFIDSLSFKGIVIDAYTGEPVENISILLYENFADTAVRKERPYYFSRTDKTGLYEFRNLKSGLFRLVAIDDTDQNLKWDGDAERIAFRDSGLVLSDSMRGFFNLKLFKNRPRFKLVGQNSNRYGLVKIGFSVPIDSVKTQILAPEGLRTLLEKTQDSLMLWYDLPEMDTSWSLVFSSPALTDPSSYDSISGAQSPKSDTFLIKKLSRDEFLKNQRIAFADMAIPSSAASGRNKSAAPPPKTQTVKTITQSRSKPADLRFNLPIISFDTALWLLTVDSNQLRDFQVIPDSASPRRLSFVFNWKDGKAHTLTFLPGAITDFWGRPNADTLRRVFNVLPEKQLGTLSMTVEKIRPGTHYILQILNGTTIQEERAFTAQTTSQKLLFDHLQVATYSARLLEDTNGNNHWDSGDFSTQQQPEPVYNRKLDPLRANWELEVSFSTEPVGERKRGK